ncbi:MAG: ATP-binding protein [Aquisalimonadaceae bacterium]
MRWSLGTRILLLAVFAPLSISLGLCAWLLSERLLDMRGDLENRGEILVRQMASASRATLRLQDLDALRHITAAALLDDAVESISIENIDGELLIRSQQLPDDASESELPPWIARLLLGADSPPVFRVPIMPIQPPLTPLRTAEVGQRPIGWINLAMNPQPMLDSQIRGLVMVAVVLLVTLLISLLCGLWARYAVSSPITKLTAVVKRLGAGDMRARVQLLASGEIGALARSVNRTAISMERSQKELSQQIDQATQELRETLEAVEIQNVELDIARKRALVGSRVKSEFLANMSHEIRTPINGILGFADLLSHSRMDQEQQDYVYTIKESCGNLLSLVNDILDFSKMEAGKLIIDSVAFDLRDCVEEVLSLMAPAAYGKNLELVHLIYSDVPLKLYGDPIRIRQVLTNLVHNSIKFTPRGRIVVRVMLEDESRQHAQLRITVSDTGIGMSTSEQQNLFKAFSQADTSITRRFGGAGLGLIICQKLLEQMGGEIGLESQPAQGSTFWFTLRCVRQPGSNNPALRKRDNPLRGRRVLLYDENTLSRLAIRHVLEAWNMDVIEVDDRQGFATGLLEQPNWDMALIGITRAELGNRHVQEILSRSPELAGPLVVLVSTVDRNELRGLYQSGARICLPKAVRRQTLFRELCRVLSPEQVRPTLEDPVTNTLPLTGTVRQKQYAGVRALVVDDNAINRKLVTTILARHGVVVDEAGDGRQSLDMASKEFYDLIFMDIHMPTMSGETAAMHIRERQSQRGVSSRIVALTANALPGERERLLRLGLNECLIKPVSEQQVLGQVRAAIKSGEISAKAGVQAQGAEQTLTQELQQMLLAELPSHREAIQNAYRGGDLADLRNQVHRLHGAASVCKVPALKECCKTLENALLRDIRVEVPNGVNHVLSEIDEILVSRST